MPDQWEEAAQSYKPEEFGGGTTVKAEEPGVLDRADSAITESLQPNPKNVALNAPLFGPTKEVGKVLGRTAYSAGKSIVGAFPAAYHAFADDPTGEEKSRYADFEKQQGEEPGAETSGVKRIGLGLDRMVGQPIRTAYDEYSHGRVTPKAALSVAPEAIGQGIGAVLTGKAIGEAPSLVKSILPERTALDPEMAARGLAKAVNPSVNEWPNFVKANAAEAGNIKAFAEKNKLPLKTQLDWSKAARGAAEEANTYFKEKVLGPHAEESVSTAGAQFKGKNAGEGQRATLGEINRRISAINDELRSAYMKKEAGQTREALASEPELKAEMGALTDILHKELAKRAGMKPEDVAGLRQRFGRMYSVADQTEAAVNQRQSSAGKAGEGRRDVPTTVAGTAEDLFNRVVRGGPEGIANRNFRKAIGNTGGIEPTTIPEVRPVPPTMQRGIPAWQLRQRLAEQTEQEPTQ